LGIRYSIIDRKKLEHLWKSVYLASNSL